MTANGQNSALFEYALRIGDNGLILGQRLSEWCGHAPILEEDIALANIALDQLGLARMALDYAGKVEGKGRDEDALAYHRVDSEFRNLLLVEQPNHDFGATIVRQVLYDAFHLDYFEALGQSRDETLAAIGAKAHKEVRYHLRHSAAWLVRLGDGTDLSRQWVQTALDDLWRYTGELFAMDASDEAMLAAGIGVDRAALRDSWDERIDALLDEATLTRPADGPMATGGRDGAMHSEHLGHLLAEMQILQRSHPGATW